MIFDSPNYETNYITLIPIMGIQMPILKWLLAAISGVAGG